MDQSVQGPKSVPIARGPRAQLVGRLLFSHDMNHEHNLGLSQRDAGLLVSILDQPQGAQLRSEYKD